MKVSVLAMVCLFAAGPAVVPAQDLSTAFEGLKDAEAKKDAAQVKKLAAEVIEIINKECAQAPEDETEKQAWTNRVAYLKQVQERTEYSLYVTAIASDAAETIDLFNTLQQVDPKSKYLDEGYGAYCAALAKSGSASKVVPAAEKGLANFPENEDLLLIVATDALGKGQKDRALTYSTRLIAAMNKHPKPEGMSAGDWERKRSATLGRGYYMAGVIHAEKGVYAAADKELRSALPLIKGNDAMMAPALFQLGVSNYQLGKMTLNKQKMQDAVTFSEECAKIVGPYAQQAWKNAILIKGEMLRMR